MAEKKLVPAIEKAMEILLLLADSGERTFGVSEIAASLGYSKGTTHSVLNTLMHYRVVDKNIRTGRYSLGDRIPQLAESYKNRQEDTTSFFTVVEEMRRSCRENINYSTLRGMHNYVLASLPAEDYSLRVDMPVGSMIPVLASSAGKVLISDFDDKTLQHIFQQQHSQFTSNTIQSCDDFIREVRQAQTNGYAVNRGEYEDGICSVAAPVANEHGRVVTAINIVVPQIRFNEKVEKKLVELALSSAKKIEEIRYTTAAR